MKCQNCSYEADVSAKFCPNCGSKITALSDAKHAHEVTLDWLKSILGRLGYKVEQTHDKKASFLATHKDRASFLVDLRSDLGFIAVQSVWKIRKAGGGKKSDMMKAINKANGISLLGIFSIDEESDSLIVSTHINLTEQITERDIVGFLDTFEKSLFPIIDASGLKDFG